MEEARLACERTGEAARCFRDFRYRTRKSWSCERRVIGKAEYLPGKANPRFVVTNLSTRDADAQHLYEDLYCARGEMEKFIGNEFSRKPRRGEAQGCAEQNKRVFGLVIDGSSAEFVGSRGGFEANDQVCPVGVEPPTRSLRRWSCETIINSASVSSAS